MKWPEPITDLVEVFGDNSKAFIITQSGDMSVGIHAETAFVVLPDWQSYPEEVQYTMRELLCQMFGEMFDGGVKMEEIASGDFAIQIKRQITDRY